MSWELPVLTSLILSVLGFWWVYSPHSSYQKALLYALLCGLTVFLDPRRIWLHMSVSPATLDELREFRLHVLLVSHFKMVLTLGAVVWLVYSKVEMPLGHPRPLVYLHLLIFASLL
ncbi:hypothetical protein BGZ63DRAFT_23608 [Mariannaea sp. PMI_226]|nr:hypothetical protein BGZ63DRAFT_23608 [Mariannaea sp. PMI_226]